MTEPQLKKSRGRKGRGTRPLPEGVLKPARNYMFTCNYTLEEGPNGQPRWKDGRMPRLLDPSLWPFAKYVVYQLELGKENGTHHFQGYMELNGVHNYTEIHRLPGLEGCWLAVRKGQQQDARRYCTKTDDPTFLDGPWEWGTPAKQGARSDLLDIQLKLDNGVSMKQIAQDHFASWNRHGRSFKEYKRINTKPRNFKTIVWLIIGPSGRGKSNFADSMARAIGPTYKVPPKKGSGMYFDDYDGQPCMILEEMNGDKMTPEFFNEFVDKYECVIPSHGAAGHQMIAKHLFITTNYHPKYWWKKRNADQIYQTTRRINIVWKMGFVYKKPFVHEAFQVFGPNINQPNVDPNIVLARDPNDDSLWPDVPPLEEGLAID